jgi:hypothetical protein
MPFVGSATRNSRHAADTRSESQRRQILAAQGCCSKTPGRRAGIETKRRIPKDTTSSAAQECIGAAWKVNVLPKILRDFFLFRRTAASTINLSTLLGESARPSGMLPIKSDRL